MSSLQNSGFLRRTAPRGWAPSDVVLLLATVATLAWIVVISRPAVTHATPLADVSLQFAFTKPRMAEMLQAWANNSGALAAARKALLWDFLLIALYTTLLIRAARQAAARFPLAALLARLMPVAALADVIENLALLAQLPNQPQAWLAAAAGVAALLKFAILSATLLACLVALVRRPSALSGR